MTIFCTGDIHGKAIERFSFRQHQTLRQLQLNDVMFQLGDFGHPFGKSKYKEARKPKNYNFDKFNNGTIEEDKKPKKEPKKVDQSLELVYRDIEEKLKESLGTKVSIISKDKGAGKMEIELFSHDELQRITEFFMNK